MTSRHRLLAAALAGGTAAAAAGAAAAQTWSGFYLGGHAGYAVGDDRTRQVDGAGRVDLGIGGPTLGVHAGWQHQWGALVAGVEVAGGHLGAEGDDDPIQDVTQITTRTELGGYATVSGRVGFVALPGLLLYGRGGVTVAAMTTRTTPFCVAPACIQIFTEARNEDVVVGATGGAGAEYMVGGRWSARLEYQYTDFGSRRAPTTTGIGPSWDHDVTLHAVRLGLSWLF